MKAEKAIGQLLFLFLLQSENPHHEAPAPRLPIGVSNLKQRIYRNFQFAKGKSCDYIFAIMILKDFLMSAFLGFT
jgi:hypothetical protein